MNGELVVVDDLHGEFAERVIECFHARPDENFSFALSGGDTARRCYERLAVDGAEQIDWWAVDVFWGDERCVPPDHPDSNERLVRCEEGPDPYQLKLGELGRLDLIHLGLGPDGHTASLFPNSPALTADPGRLVSMNTDPSGHNPHERMTLTFAGIARGRHVIFTVSGEEKRDAMRQVMEGEDVPAARVQAERVLWLVDRSAYPG
jgi:6-phosphogluconolactonase